ncbi:hypothetical protein LELG_03115 [Lodderomyces elongisporus NRRL YB-4239]|uniref:N-glycosylation protein EOS1 n=1 Tax=Lodderomyces elongisporus (strain ATCC 11503 / CBS 2605 / JCM 1781 / NBRC 1676 / NRRL YB-4239) TaxID=379508 RepID=A5E0H8_LODEL|nr:hypothetical protein LELG_03115 [Lodderomyces elongisporus NRRL YB-4239]
MSLRQESPEISASESQGNSSAITTTNTTNTAIQMPVQIADLLENNTEFGDQQLPTYEVSQRLHQRRETTHSSNRRSSSSISSSALGFASHFYTPIPSLPIPRTSAMLQLNSSDSSFISSTPIPTPVSVPNTYANENTISSQQNLQQNLHQYQHQQQQRHRQQQQQQQHYSPELHITNNRSTSSNNLSSLGSNSRASKLQQSSIKKLGLKLLNARQHFLLASCRDISLIPPLFGLFQSWKRISHEEVNNMILNNTSSNPLVTPIPKITTAMGLEHFLTGVWCIVAAYLSYSILDSLLVRWIVTYSTSAAIVRVLSMSTIIITLEMYFVSAFSAEGYKYGLHIWILISCILTLTYIVQNFVTLNLQLENYTNDKVGNDINTFSAADMPQQPELTRPTASGSSTSLAGTLEPSARMASFTFDAELEPETGLGPEPQLRSAVKKKSVKPRRFFDFYNIVVFAVVPVGLASFITMIGLLRSLLILRIDVDQALGMTTST